MKQRLMSVVFALMAACASAGPRTRSSALSSGAPASTPNCSSCNTLTPNADVTAAIAVRVADLKARGGDCLIYGEVLESSLMAGRITIKPYMWRVGPNLASASATSSGDMTLAREVDSLNVGVRTVSDVLRSVEHEAAHIAFRLTAGDPASEQRADDHVLACRADAATAAAPRRNK